MEFEPLGGSQSVENKRQNWAFLLFSPLLKTIHASSQFFDALKDKTLTQKKKYIFVILKRRIFFRAREHKIKTTTIKQHHQHQENKRSLKSGENQKKKDAVFNYLHGKIALIGS